MPISMYGASVPVYLTTLKGLAHVLSRGEADAAERGIDPQSFLDARLAPDMFPLTAQVRIATDHAKGSVARLAGRDMLRLEDDEKSFAELQARIVKTRDFLKQFSEADLEGSEERPIELKLPGRTLSFTGQQYLQYFALPNFYFHVTAAYAILRHNGVPLGKVDFFAGR